jgi:hypothetical protein
LLSFMYCKYCLLSFNLVVDKNSHSLQFLVEFNENE